MRFVLYVLVFSGVASSAIAKEDAPWRGVVDFNTKIGNERTIGSIDVMLPLQQDDNHLLFLDTRGIFTDQDTSEGNIGVGFRCKKCISDEYIVGGYGFFDRRRSQYDKYFSQFTIGTEILGRDWDFRVNGYLPISEKELISQTAATAELGTDGSVLIDNGQTFEKSLRGYDIEVGRRLDNSGDTWGYFAFYKFGGWEDPNVDGVRLRVHSDITDWLRIGGETSYDGPRGHVSFAEMRIRVPLGPKPKVKPSILQRKFYEPIVRDIDIVTRSVRPKPQKATNANGEEIKVLFVDNTAAAGGNGTPGNPYNNLADAATNVQTSWIIYVNEGDGTTANMNAGIDIDKNSVSLIGEGVALSVNGVEVLPAGNAPRITNTGGDAVTISADDVEIAGLTIDSPANSGISILNQNYLHVHDVTVNNAGINGVRMLYTGSQQTATVENTTITGSALNGVGLEISGGANITAAFSNNTITTNGGKGVDAKTSNNSRLTATLSGNTISDNTGRAVDIENASTNQVDITALNNTLNNNGSAAFRYSATATGTMNVTSSNNTMNGNFGNTLAVRTTNNGRINGVFTNDVLVGSTTGILIQSNNDSSIDVSLNGVSSDADLLGVTTAANNASNMLFSMSNSTFTGNPLAGANLVASSTGTVVLDLGGGSLGSIGQNRFYDNANVDIQIVTGGRAVYAQHNWWGDVTGLQPAKRSIVSGTLDSSNFLTADPN